MFILKKSPPFFYTPAPRFLVLKTHKNSPFFLGREYLFFPPPPIFFPGLFTPPFPYLPLLDPPSGATPGGNKPPPRGKRCVLPPPSRGLEPLKGFRLIPRPPPSSPCETLGPKTPQKQFRWPRKNGPQFSQRD